jgi:hypothetical protein
MIYRTIQPSNTVTNNVLLKLFVPHSVFGTNVDAATWDLASESGSVMAALPFKGAMVFFWYALMGWSFADYGSDGVVFIKLTPSDSE